MNKRRLLKLADLLEADAKNKKGVKFDLGIVAAHSEPIMDSFVGRRTFAPGEKPTLDCRTAACAVGLAAISGAFKREGLGYYISRDYGLHPKFKGSRGFGRADRRFFNLSQMESQFLFEPCGYDNTPVGAKGERIVAKRIRDFVAGKVKAA